jgi:hypothetical protein
VTGYDVASLRNMAWVASQFDPSLRSDDLSWSHHVLLAPLEPEQQQGWLERARKERLSVADLRLELRAARSAQRKSAESTRVDLDPESDGVCPHCGHRLSTASE